LLSCPASGRPPHLEGEPVDPLSRAGGGVSGWCKESGGPFPGKEIGGSGPTMKVSPGVAQRDLGTSTVSLTGLPPLMCPSRPVNTRQTTKRRPRRSVCLIRRDQRMKAGAPSTGSNKEFLLKRTLAASACSVCAPPGRVMVSPPTSQRKAARTQSEGAALKESETRGPKGRIKAGGF
jgi:hypothetical protein